MYPLKDDCKQALELLIRVRPTESNFILVNFSWVIHGKCLSHLFQGSFMGDVKVTCPMGHSWETCKCDLKSS